MSALIRQAREDSAQVANATVVERVVTGAPGTRPQGGLDRSAFDRDSLAGSVMRRGYAQGQHQALRSARPRGDGESRDRRKHRETRTRRVRVDRGARRRQAPTIVAAASLDTVQAAGFALDSVEARVTARGTTGAVDVTIHQHESHDYRSGRQLCAPRRPRELHLDRLRSRFDTTEWVSARPSTIRWGGRGVEILALDLRQGTRGRIYVNGLVPTEGSGPSRRRDLRPRGVARRRAAAVGHRSDGRTPGRRSRRRERHATRACGPR